MKTFLRQYEVFSFPFFSSHKQTTAKGGLTTRRIVVYPFREFERQEVLDGVEERRRRDEELPFGQEARRLGKDCGITVKRSKLLKERWDLQLQRDMVCM